MPVSVTEKRTEPTACGAMRRRTVPCRVNLKALASRFFSTCFSRVASVRMVSGSPGAMSIENSRPFSCAICRKVRSRSARRSSKRAGAMCSAVIAPDSIFARSRISLIRFKRSVPDS